MNYQALINLTYICNLKINFSVAVRKRDFHTLTKTGRFSASKKNTKDLINVLIR